MLQKYYPRPTENLYNIVPINKIIIDRAIVDAIKKYNDGIPREILVSKERTTPLNRMEPVKDIYGTIQIPSVLDAMRAGIALPAVKLRPYGSTGYFIIIEGRHRIASAIIMGFGYVPAIII